MSLDFNPNDLLTLEQQRMERFRSDSLHSLSLCWLHLNHDNTLAVHCAEPWIVDQLLYEMEQLCWDAWVLVGASRLSIYYAQEEIYAANTQKFGEPTRSQPSLAPQHRL
jgi:hypothetical protein